jgi:hypothetical protein
LGGQARTVGNALEGVLIARLNPSRIAGIFSERKNVYQPSAIGFFWPASN